MKSTLDAKDSLYNQRIYLEGLNFAFDLCFYVYNCLSVVTDQQTKIIKLH